MKSSVDYNAPLQQANLLVLLTSPLGETNQTPGFWDGGQTWRFRFSPTQLGLWSYRTICSDTANSGLNNRTGQFLCTPSLDLGRFGMHGSVRAARNHRHFEHQDGTPFFWLADPTLRRRQVESSKAIQSYAAFRSAQSFTVSEWCPIPLERSTHAQAFSGLERVTPRPGYFKTIDARITMLKRAGLLCAIEPFSLLNDALGSTGRLPEDQIVLLANYMLARWSAEPVAWVLDLGESSTGGDLQRWLRVARATFAHFKPSLVLVRAAKARNLLQPFDAEDWVDAFAFSTIETNPTSAGAFSPPDWFGLHPRPWLGLVPCQLGFNLEAQSELNEQVVRQYLYSYWLKGGVAGISCCCEPEIDLASQAQGAAWESTLETSASNPVIQFAKFVNSVDFWKLRPMPRQNPAPAWLGAVSEDKSLFVAYTSHDLEFPPGTLLNSPAVSWFNPRTGRSFPAQARMQQGLCQLPLPELGDWLLLARQTSP